VDEAEDAVGLHPAAMAMAMAMAVHPAVVVVVVVVGVDGDVNVGADVGAAAEHPFDEDAWIKTNCDVRWTCWPKMPVNGRWVAALLASRTPIPSPRSIRMKENPKSIVHPLVCRHPTPFEP